MKVRQSNMELLRIIAILMITMHHTIIDKYRGSIVDGNVLLDGWQINTILNSFVYIGVNLFVLISGYFGIKFKWKGVLNLFIMCVFYMFINLLVSTYILHADSFSFRTIIYRSLNAFTQTSKWFVLAYTVLYFISPFLNAAIEYMSKEQYKRALILLSIYCLYFGFIRRVNLFNDTGYSVGQFIWLYFIAGYIRKFNIADKAKKHKFLLCSIYLGCCIMWAVLTIINNNGFHIPLWRQTTYNNPFTWSASIAFFCIFTTYSFHSKWVNYIAKSALAVYLFSFPISYYTPIDFFNQLWGVPYIGIALVWTLIRFCVAVSIDQIRMLCMIPVDYIWNHTGAKYIQ